MRGLLDFLTGYFECDVCEVGRKLKENDIIKLLGLLTVKTIHLRENKVKFNIF